MRIGVVFPQTEIGADPAVIRDYAQTVEALGYNHVLAYDHVLGANPVREGGWHGPYTYRDSFHEPFVLFSYLAAATRDLEFMPGVLILPQRETALVAKQAAALDVLSGGRLRLGVGTGWNEVEYIALGQDFHRRGKRMDEQLALMRALWTEELVTFQGRWHTVLDAGLNPLPVQRPIPIWFGGRADIVLRRVARAGQGWLPPYRRVAEAAEALQRLWDYVETAGRRREEIGLEPRLHFREVRALASDNQAGLLVERLHEWEAGGATHISVNTMDAGFVNVSQHLAALERFMVALGR
jgi:probable F420-dependent oxidoreductase